MRSIVTLRMPQTPIETSSEQTIATASDALDECPVRWNTEISIVAANIAPSMKTSPCAKLISSRIP